MLAEITPLNYRLISMGWVVIGPSCFVYVCPKVISASSFISLRSFEYLCFRFPFLHTLQLFFVSHFTSTVSPGHSSFYPSPSQTGECLPEPSRSPLTPYAPFPSPLDRAPCCHRLRHTAVTASC